MKGDGATAFRWFEETSNGALGWSKVEALGLISVTLCTPLFGCGPAPEWGECVVQARYKQCKLPSTQPLPTTPATINGFEFDQLSNLVYTVYTILVKLCSPIQPSRWLMLGPFFMIQGLRDERQQHASCKMKIPAVRCFSPFTGRLHYFQCLAVKVMGPIYRTRSIIVLDWSKNCLGVNK